MMQWAVKDNIENHKRPCELPVGDRVPGNLIKLHTL